MKLTKSQLKQIIREELKEIVNPGYGEPQSWSEIAIDKAVSALIESTYDEYDPPQRLLDVLELKIRDALSTPDIKSIFDTMTADWKRRK